MEWIPQILFLVIVVGGAYFLNKELSKLEEWKPEDKIREKRTKKIITKAEYWRTIHLRAVRVAGCALLLPVGLIIIGCMAWFLISSGNPGKYLTNSFVITFLYFGAIFIVYSIPYIAFGYKPSLATLKRVVIPVCIGGIVASFIVTLVLIFGGQISNDLGQLSIRMAFVSGIIGVFSIWVLNKILPPWMR